MYSFQGSSEANSAIENALRNGARTSMGTAGAVVNNKTFNFLAEGANAETTNKSEQSSFPWKTILIVSGVGVIVWFLYRKFKHKG